MRTRSSDEPENAAFYFLNFVSWARANSVQYFYFEAYDEPWKAAREGPQGACWGLWDQNSQLKAGMQAVFDDQTLADNWTAPPAELIVDFGALPVTMTTNLPTFLVAGHTDPGNTVSVNGSPLPPEAIDEAGNFTVALPLAVGENVIELIVEAPASAVVSQESKTVTYDPAFSTLERRLLYVDVVDVVDGAENDRPELSGTVVIDLDGNTLLGLLQGKHVRGVSPDGKATEATKPRSSAAMPPAPCVMQLQRTNWGASTSETVTRRRPFSA